MKKSMIISIFFLFALNISVLHAEDNNLSWYDETKNYASETAHNMITDDVSFASIYKESSSVGWGTVALVTVVVVGATAVTIFSGGTAAPALAAAASSMPGVASAAGLAGAAGTTGAAATASGLAAVGSVVGGGMAAGIVVVSAGLTFGTEVVVDYTIGKALDEYSYSNFAENSKHMKTLPIPKNTDGCNSYEDAMEIIEGIDSDSLVSSENTQGTIKKAIDLLKPIPEEKYNKAKSIVDEMSMSDIWDNSKQFNNASDIVNRYEDEKRLDDDERAKKESLLSLLYFITNNYKEAKKYSKLSITLADKANVKHTLPSYIYATSSLYDESFDYNKLADEYLKYSFVNETDNPIISLLLSIHLDRMMYRFGDGIVDEKSLNKVFSIVSDESLKDLKLGNYIIVLSQYLMGIKLEQQKISSLSLTENQTIKNSPKTLFAIKNSFENYENLINGATNIVKALEDIEAKDEAEVEVKKKVDVSKELITQYTNDKARLQQLIQDLETYQASFTKNEISEVKEAVVVVNDTKNIYLYVVLAIVLLTLILFFIMRRKKEQIVK